MANGLRKLINSDPEVVPLGQEMDKLYNHLASRLKVEKLENESHRKESVCYE